jgi:hypothetical protein
LHLKSACPLPFFFGGGGGLTHGQALVRAQMTSSARTDLLGAHDFASLRFGRADVVGLDASWRLTDVRSYAESRAIVKAAEEVSLSEARAMDFAAEIIKKCPQRFLIFEWPGRGVSTRRVFAQIRRTAQ